MLCAIAERGRRILQWAWLRHLLLLVEAVQCDGRRGGRKDGRAMTTAQARARPSRERLKSEAWRVAARLGRRFG